MKPFVLILSTILFFAAAYAQPVYDNQDCVGAVPLCYGRYELPYTFSGIGNEEELFSLYDVGNPDFCLINGENNTAWYKLQFTSSGILLFTIDPISQQDDYDFALFDVTGKSCADIPTNVAPYVRCNYSLSIGNATGLALGSTQVSSGVNGDHLLAPLSVDSGDVIYLVVDNFTYNGGGFVLDFAGTTANMISDDSFYVTSGYTTVMTDTIKVDMFFNQSFYCGTLSNDFSEFSLTDDTGYPLNVIAVDCDSVSRRVTVTTLHPTHVVTSVTVGYQDGFDGNIIIAQCGGAELMGTPKTFEVRNGPGKLDFSHTSDADTFWFTPIAHPSALLRWYVKDTLQTMYNTHLLRKVFLTAKPYRVCLVADYGYTTDSVCKYFSTTGIGTIEASKAFTLYPNPAQGELSINLPYGAKHIEIMDVSGKVAKRFDGAAIGQTVVLHTGDLPQGLYLVKVTHTKGVATQKLQVIH